MRWLVTGAAGMLGNDVIAELVGRGHDVTGAARGDLDVTDDAACRAAAGGHDVVVNCAAYTAVDAAEKAEPEAFAVNAVGAATVARAAHQAGARVVHLSTDYVFGGRSDTPWPVDAPLRPLSSYGRTKAAGEWAVRAEDPSALIVRTAWLYGATGSSFPKTIARVVAERGAASVVDDQIGQPTWTVDVARLIVDLIEHQAPAGIYHGTAGGQASWYEFARAVVAAAGMDPNVVAPTTTENFPRPASRPAYSVFSHDTVIGAGVTPIGAWAERWSTAAPTVLGS